MALTPREKQMIMLGISLARGVIARLALKAPKLSVSDMNYNVLVYQDMLAEAWDTEALHHSEVNAIVDEVNNAMMKKNPDKTFYNFKGNKVPPRQ